jgi:CDP-diacylglycerol pyrophosphatase
MCSFRRAACVASLVHLIGVTPQVAALERDMLWRVVNDACVPGERSIGVPFPCQWVDLERGIAVLAPKLAHLMLVPTTRLHGIESDELLKQDVPNYWDFAWRARQGLNESLGVDLSRDKIALAINPAGQRSQDQLHIHIGCIRPDVQTALQVYERDIRETWPRLPFAIGPGEFYRILRIEQQDLGAINPFQLVAAGIPDARTEMARYTIVVAGAEFKDGNPGFYVLAARSGQTPSAGESLLDYDCVVADLKDSN